MEKVSKFLDDNYDLLQETDFLDIVFDFDTWHCKDYNCKIYTNVFVLNFPGTHDWFWFLSIPDNDLATYKDNFDKYPVYHIDLEVGICKKEYKNIREFLLQWFPKEKLDFLSKDTIKQSIPIIELNI